MSKREFLDELRQNLKNNVSEMTINSQIDYYEKYISSEVAKGRNELEVIKELGNPRLIARTIIEVNPGEGIEDEGSYTSYASSRSDGYNGSETYSETINQDGSSSSTYERTTYSNTGSTMQGLRFFNMGGCGCIVTILIICVIIWGVVSLFGIAVGGIINLLGPVLGIIVLGALAYFFFFRT